MQHSSNYGTVDWEQWVNTMISGSGSSGGDKVPYIGEMSTTLKRGGEPITLRPISALVCPKEAVAGNNGSPDHDSVIKGKRRRVMVVDDDDDDDDDNCNRQQKPAPPVPAPGLAPRRKAEEDEDDDDDDIDQHYDPLPTPSADPSPGQQKRLGPKGYERRGRPRSEKAAERNRVMGTVTRMMPSVMPGARDAAMSEEDARVWRSVIENRAAHMRGCEFSFRAYVNELQMSREEANAFYERMMEICRDIGASYLVNNRHCLCIVSEQAVPMTGPNDAANNAFFALMSPMVFNLGGRPLYTWRVDNSSKASRAFVGAYRNFVRGLVTSNSLTYTMIVKAHSLNFQNGMSERQNPQRCPAPVPGSPFPALQGLETNHTRMRVSDFLHQQGLRNY